jgi:hypothetical protein
MPARRLAALLMLLLPACRHGAAGGRLAAGPGMASHHPRLMLWDVEAMEAIRARLPEGDAAQRAAVARLRAEADQALGRGPFTVMAKRLAPPSGDKHDYMSVAPYFWPDPGRPGGLPYVRRDGERNPQRNSADTDNVAESSMASDVETLALAHFFTGHPPYAEHAARLLRVWFIDPATRMNPNLQFAQAVPGVTPGRPTGIIDTVDLVTLVEAVELLARSGSLPARELEGLRAWFAGYLGWLLDSDNGKREGRASNNHGSWYDVQTCRFALFLDRDQQAREIVERARTQRIGLQIEPDGRQPRELDRTRSLSYSLYNLNALFSLATMGERLGVDLFHFETPDGRSLRRALDFVAPYADPATPWPYRQIGGRDARTLIPLLKQASHAYHEARYDDALSRSFGAELATHRVTLVR